METFYQTSEVMERETLILVLVVAVVLTLLTNLMFSMYHLYMRRNKEYQTRLLNILFCHLAAILQTCSLLHLAIITDLGEYQQLYDFYFMIKTAQSNIMETYFFKKIIHFKDISAALFTEHEIFNVDLMRIIRPTFALIIFLYILIIGLLAVSP